MNALTTTSSQEEDVSSARIDDMLRGAYIALKNADSQSSPLPVKTRLVLASAGSTEQGWQQVIAQQKAVSTTSAQGRLIAIAGMGISVTQTQQIQAMIRYLERPGEPLAAVKGKRPPVAVVADVNIDDLYKQSMQTGFDAFFPNLPQDATHRTHTSRSRKASRRAGSSPPSRRTSARLPRRRWCSTRAAPTSRCTTPTSSSTRQASRSPPST